MPAFATTNDHTQIIVPLRITPSNHQALPTITGSLFSDEAGAVLYGHYNMEYLLPRGDRLRLIANHNKKTVQLLLFTHQNELITRLPGARTSSLVADCISKINSYRIRCDSYKHPLRAEQEQKLQIANQGIELLNKLLEAERQLYNKDYEGHETLRKEALQIIEHCQDENRLIANNPLVSEGALGDLLYDAHKIAAHYIFNRVYAVSRQDQMDFSNIPDTPSLVWDSELHIGHESKDLDDALRVICNYYQLVPAKSLNDVAANRFSKIAAFVKQLRQDGQDWVNHLAIPTQPTHKTEIESRPDGVSLINITPYYKLHGLTQSPFPDLKTLISQFTKSTNEPIQAENTKTAQKLLEPLAHGNCAIIASEEKILIKQANQLISIRYFTHENLLYPLPEGQDLYTLGQISKHHLYLPERASLQFKAFTSRVPGFFYTLYHSLRRFIVHDLHEEFFNHVHASHVQKKEPKNRHAHQQARSKKRDSLVLVLKNEGHLANGQTLEEFIQEQISTSHYVIARANHPPSPPAYENPFHRILNVLRHVAGFFIETSERNPMIGTLAMAAYAYGGGAILAPEALRALLTKLHLKGLIAGIEPTQQFAHLLNHGAFSEAVSVSVAYWQAAVIGGNLDKFFIEAIKALQEDPAEIAIIAALALSLGYGLTKAIPALEHEMGDFPYMNYAALGGKGGAALFDTIMHPGDDWLLGTGKWLGKFIVTLSKLLVAPLIEGYHYGYADGFLHGMQKNKILLKKISKQMLVASVDFLLALLTIPLIELSALFIHLPFRGITNLFSKTLAAFGTIHPLGEAFLAFAARAPLPNLLASFKVSPLYGFSSPFGAYVNNPFLNLGINIITAVVLPLLQVLKNFVMLPLLDTLSIALRIVIIIANPLSRMAASALGNVLCTVGSVTDNSIGFLLTTIARSTTRACNWIVNKASNVKQNLLSFIASQRSHLYDWGFAEEDGALHKELNDAEYYRTEPRRYECIPHSDSHCLLHTLLNVVTNGAQPQSSEPIYTEVFSNCPPISPQLQCSQLQLKSG